MKKRGPKAYDEEFRREALRLAEVRPVTQVACELGIHPETLRGWRRLARARAEEEATPLISHASSSRSARTPIW